LGAELLDVLPACNGAAKRQPVIDEERLHRAPPSESADLTKPVRLEII
jgi:hypothetical protein